MATKNAPFYSCRAGRLDTLKSHQTLSRAMASAGECGQIWVAENACQQQVYKTIMGEWAGTKPDGRAVDIKSELSRLGLIQTASEGDS